MGKSSSGRQRISTEISNSKCNHWSLGYKGMLSPATTAHILQKKKTVNVQQM